jgi:ketosteroid isomerase-like protein
MKRSFGWVLVFAAIAAFLVEGCGSGAPKDTRAEDEATIRAYSVTAREAARTKDVDKVTSFYADDALAFSNYSATTTTKEAMRADLRNAFSAPGNAQLENLGHRSGAFGRSGLRTRPLHVHDHGKRREEQNTNGELPVGVAKAARQRLEDSGRYGHRGSAARATYAASAIYEIIHASKFRVRTCLCKRRGI